MKAINIEIKASCTNPDKIRKLLLELNADFKGTDLQTDSYFNVQQGRLKLREGNIENNLIYYQRSNQEGPKQSDFSLLTCEKDSQLKQMLTDALGILVVVNKKREIYYIENTKFHIDYIENLGYFVEIEVKGNFETEREQLTAICNKYIQLFEIQTSDLLAISYSDMLISLQRQ